MQLSSLPFEPALLCILVVSAKSLSRDAYYIRRSLIFLLGLHEGELKGGNVGRGDLLGNKEVWGLIWDRFTGCISRKNIDGKDEKSASSEGVISAVGFFCVVCHIFGGFY